MKFLDLSLIYSTDYIFNPANGLVTTKQTNQQMDENNFLGRGN